MATISLTIPDAALDRVLDAFDGSYSGRVDDEDTELFTLAQWTKMHMADFVKQTLVAYEISVAVAEVKETARANADLVDIA